MNTSWILHKPDRKTDTITLHADSAIKNNRGYRWKYLGDNKISLLQNTNAQSNKELMYIASSGNWMSGIDNSNIWISGIRQR